MPVMRLNVTVKLLRELKPSDGLDGQVTIPLGIVKHAARLSHPLLVEHLLETLAVALVQHLGDILIVAAHLVGQLL